MKRPRPAWGPGSGIRGPGSATPGLLITVVLLVGCASSRPARQPVSAPAPNGSVEVGWSEEGLASWYGEPYHGRPTAAGPRYDMNEMTAAHRTLPFGTIVRVTNLESDREAEVVVNDRGPFVAGRIVDLSRAAADRLGVIGPGIARVRLTVVRTGDGMPGATCWEVQVGAFAKAENVARAERDLASRALETRTAPAGGGLTRVRVTGLTALSSARALARELDGAYPGAVPVPCGGGR